jgi:capsular exopolysaccharide synthesis family protein
MDPLKSQPAPEAKLHFLDYWRIIRIRKTVILAVFLLVVITATLVTFILPQSFSSTARIRVERDSTDIEGFTQRTPFSPSYDPYFIQTEFEVIQSEVILGKVIEKMNLNVVWGQKMGVGTLKTTDTIGMVKSRIDLNPKRNTSLIEIRVFSDSPEEAAQLANAIADAYLEHRQEKGRKLASGGIDALKLQFTEQDEKVKEAQTRVDFLRKNLEISDMEAMGGAPSPMLEAETVRQLNGQLFAAETYVATEETRLAELLKLTPEQRRDAIQTTVGPDSELSELLTQHNLIQQQLLGLQKDYTPENPVYVNVRARADELAKRINQRVEGIITGLRARVSAQQAAVDKLKEKLETARQKDIEKSRSSRPYYDAKLHLEELLQFRKALNIKLYAEGIDLKLPKSAMVEILDRATPDPRPVRPNKPLNIALGIIIGLAVGIGLAFFIEYLDTSVKTIDDVERTLQAPVLGVIPQNVGYLVDEGSESPHAEAYRVLRTNLLFSRKDDKLNTVAIVSAGAGEGKSTTVMNLATVFAQGNQRVLIVDSDLRRPTLHKMMRVTNSLGLTNYLLKQNTLEEVIQTTGVPSLDFMASGRLPSSSLGILSSAAMKDLIGELKQRYDYVFFDSPPIMGVSDASILASEVDMTLQVIQYRRYPQPMNIRAKQLIEKVGGNLVGIVLNNINMSQDESYYYYSGYYHDYYSKNEEAAEGSAPGKANGEKAKIEIKQKY